MHLITRPLQPDPAFNNRIPIRIDRHALAKRRFRAAAEDGTDFGFDLLRPLQHGDAVHQDQGVVYYIDQSPEPVLRIPFADGKSGALYGWMIGNMHFPATFEPDHIIAPDDPAVRQLLDRNNIDYQQAQRVFEPAIIGAAHHH